MIVDVLNQRLIFSSMKADGENRVFRIVPYTENSLLNAGYEKMPLLDKSYPDFLFFHRKEDKNQNISEDFAVIQKTPTM